MGCLSDPPVNSQSYSSLVRNTTSKSVFDGRGCVGRGERMKMTLVALVDVGSAWC
jgi:hypothetical protein